MATVEAKTKAAKLTFVGLAFAGWSLLLAGTAFGQAQLGGAHIKSFRNFPVAGVMDQLVAGTFPPASALIPVANPFTGLPTSYSWWLVIFQLVALIFATVAIEAAPGLQRMAVPLLTVLTTSVFLFTCSLLNAPLGVYAVTHNSSGTPASAVGNHASKASNGVLLTFSGAIILALSDTALAMTLGEPALYAAASAVAAKEVVAVQDVEAVAADAV